MLTGQRGGLHREVTDEDRPVELVLTQVLPDLLDELAVAPAALGRDIQADDLRQGLELLDGGVDGDLGDRGLLRELASQCLVEGGVHLHDAPFAAEVVLGAVDEGDGGGTEDLDRDLLDDVVDQLRTGVIGAVGLVGLQHGELRGVGGIHALVAEVAVDLEDLVDTADDAALEVELRGDTQEEVDVESVGVRLEGAGGGAAVQGLQHRGLDLEKTTTLQGVAQRTHDLDTGQRIRPGLLTHDEVGVAVTDPGILTHLLVRDRERTQRLGGHGPGVRHDGELASTGGDDASVDEDDVTEVDVGLPGRQGVLPHLGQRQHGLHLGAVALLQAGEGELAGVAHEDDAAGDADLVGGLFTRREVGDALDALDGGSLLLILREDRIGREDLGEGAGAVDDDRVGVLPLGQQARTLLAADLQLLREVGGGCVVCGLGILLLVSHGHPAYCMAGRA